MRSDLAALYDIEDHPDLYVRAPLSGVTFPVPSAVEIVAEADGGVLARDHARLGLPPFPALSWRFDRLDGPRTPPIGRALASFIELRAASDEAVLLFAKKWGPLGICHHWCLRSVEHDVLCQLAGFPTGTVLSDLRATPALEPISAWRYFARKAWAIMRVLAVVTGATRNQTLLTRQTGKRMHDAGAGVLWSNGDEAHLPRLQQDSEVLGYTVALEITDWLRDATLSPVVRWAEGAFQPGLAPHGGELHDIGFLYPIVAYQLAALLRRPEQLAQCRRCGTPFPRSGKERMCSDYCRYQARCATKKRSWAAHGREWRPGGNG